MDVRNVADLLHALALEQRARLDDQPITHAPTIGQMYEGLAKELLDAVFVEPDAPPLFVGTGFVRGPNNALSGQMDVVIATENDGAVPNTGAHYFDYRNVIAVIEVKKRGYKRDLSDGVEHLARLADFAFPIPEYFVDEQFAFLTGLVPDGEWYDFSPLHQWVYQFLMPSLSAPLRVVWGLHGYNRHDSFRENLLEIIAPAGPIGNVSTLVISGDHVAVVEDGLPWSNRRVVNEWDFCSTHEGVPPLYFVIEALWTRLRFRTGNFEALRGDTIRLPSLWPLLRFALNGQEVIPMLVDLAQSRSHEHQYTPVVFEDPGFQSFIFSSLHEPSVRKLVRERMQENDDEAAKIRRCLAFFVDSRLAKQSMTDPERYLPMDNSNIMSSAPGEPLVAHDPRSWRFHRWIKRR